MDNENNLKSRRSDHQTLYSAGFLSKSLLSGKTDLGTVRELMRHLPEDRRTTDVAVRRRRP